MDRRHRLAEIYEESGLKAHLESNGLVNEPKRDFSKLKFVPNDFGVRSIELWDLQSGGTYFRIHHREAAKTGSSPRPSSFCGRWCLPGACELTKFGQGRRPLRRRGGAANCSLTNEEH